MDHLTHMTVGDALLWAARAGYTLQRLSSADVPGLRGYAAYASPFDVFRAPAYILRFFDAPAITKFRWEAPACTT